MAEDRYNKAYPELGYRQSKTETKVASYILGPVAVMDEFKRRIELDQELKRRQKNREFQQSLDMFYRTEPPRVWGSRDGSVFDQIDTGKYHLISGPGNWFYVVEEPEVVPLGQPAEER